MGLQENKEIKEKQKFGDVLLREEITDANLKKVVNNFVQNIKTILEKSEKDDAKQYREETSETQEKIQQFFIAKAFDNEKIIELTENDVVGALKEYYNDPNKEESNAVSFGALAAVMCMLVLN